MSTTKEKIMQLGEEVIRRKGYNAFSYQDISVPLQIKNAAIHYYYPKKSDLAIAIFRATRKRFDDMWARETHSTSRKKLQAFIKVYADSAEMDMVCLVGSMAAEYYSLEDPVREELKLVVDDITQKLTDILATGRKNKDFNFSETPHTKALMIVTNLLAGLQLGRIAGRKQFDLLKGNILKSIT